MQLEEYPAYAEKLMKQWSAWQKGSNTSYFWQPYRETFAFLKEHGLVSDRSCANPDDFVLRQAVHGSPILLRACPLSFFQSHFGDILSEKPED